MDWRFHVWPRFFHFQSYLFGVFFLFVENKLCFGLLLYLPNISKKMLYFLTWMRCLGEGRRRNSVSGNQLEETPQ